MTAHRQFETQLRNFGNEASNVARYVYADFSIQHAASKSQLLLTRLNETPTFWLTVSASFQTAAYISLGRIFDNDSRYNIDKLLSSAESNIALFQRDALAERKREGRKYDPSWLKQYLDEAYYPNQSDFVQLKKKVAQYRALYEKAIKPARNKYIAHREKQGPDEVSELFGRGKVKDIYRLTMFLHQLYQILWELFHNGRKPRFCPMRYSVASILRQANSGSAAHENIVNETQKLMQLIENATPNPSLHRTNRKHYT